jgi:hypothetical protein
VGSSERDERQEYGEHLAKLGVDVTQVQLGHKGTISGGFAAASSPGVSWLAGLPVLDIAEQGEQGELGLR